MRVQYFGIYASEYSTIVSLSNYFLGYFTAWIVLIDSGNWVDIIVEVIYRIFRIYLAFVKVWGE